MGFFRQRRKPDRLHRFASLGVIGVGAGLLLGLRLANSPARVFRLPPHSRPIAVFNGNLYFQMLPSAHNRVEIHSKPLNGGESRRVLLDEGFSGRVLDLKISEQGFVYRYQEPFSPPPPVRVPLDARERKLLRTHTTWQRVPRMRLRSAPLAGGRPRELLGNQRAVDLCVSGSTGFWVESDLIAPGPSLRKPKGFTPRNTLYSAPLSGGATRKVAELPPGVFALWPGPNGVSWRVSVGDSSSQLVTAMGPDFSPALIADWNSESPPVELGGYLYGLNSGNRAKSAGIQPHRVVRFKPDGSARHTVFEADPTFNGDGALQALTTDGRFLFVHLTNSRRSKQGSEQYESSLVRITPDGAKPEVIAKWTAKVNSFPMVLGRNGDHLYYSASHLYENWFDWSPQGLSPDRIIEVFRVQVPR